MDDAAAAAEDDDEDEFAAADEDDETLFEEDVDGVLDALDGFGLSLLEAPSEPADAVLMAAAVA